MTTMAEARVYDVTIHYPDPGPHEQYGRTITYGDMLTALYAIRRMTMQRVESGFAPARFTLRSRIGDDI